jgi:hypothetical protein
MVIGEAALCQSFPGNEKEKSIGRNAEGIKSWIAGGQAMNEHTTGYHPQTPHPEGMAAIWQQVLPSCATLSPPDSLRGIRG